MSEERERRLNIGSVVEYKNQAGCQQKSTVSGYLQLGESEPASLVDDMLLQDAIDFNKDIVYCDAKITSDSRFISHHTGFLAPLDTSKLSSISCSQNPDSIGNFKGYYLTHLEQDCMNGSSPLEKINSTTFTLGSIVTFLIILLAGVASIFTCCYKMNKSYFSKVRQAKYLLNAINITYAKRVPSFTSFSSMKFSGKQVLFTFIADILEIDCKSILQAEELIAESKYLGATKGLSKRLKRWCGIVPYEDYVDEVYKEDVQYDIRMLKAAYHGILSGKTEKYEALLIEYKEIVQIAHMIIQDMPGRKNDIKYYELEDDYVIENQSKIKENCKKFYKIAKKSLFGQSGKIQITLIN